MESVVCMPCHSSAETKRFCYINWAGGFPKCAINSPSVRSGSSALKIRSCWRWWQLSRPSFVHSTARLLGLDSLCSDGNASIGLAEQRLPAEGNVSSVEMRSQLMLILIPNRTGLTSLHFELQPALQTEFW